MTELLAWVVVLVFVGLYVSHYNSSLRDGIADLVGPNRRRRRVLSPVSRPMPKQAARASAETQRYGEHVAKVTALTVAQARARAEKYMGNARLWEVVPADTGDAERVAPLGPALRELLGRWRAVKALYGEVNLTVDEMAPDQLPGDDVLTFGERRTHSQDCWRVGHDVDGNPVLEEANADVLYVVHRDGGSSWTTSFPSVYHWILIRAYRVDGAGDGDRG